MTQQNINNMLTLYNNINNDNNVEPDVCVCVCGSKVNCNFFFLQLRFPSFNTILAKNIASHKCVKSKNVQKFCFYHEPTSIIR